MISQIGKRKNGNNPAAFTLIELTLVLLLITVLLGISTPLFRKTFSGLEVKNASFNLSKAVNYAQEMAIIEKTNFKINFDFKENKFWMTKLEKNDEFPSYKTLSGRYGKSVFMPKGVKLKSETEEIIFYPDGQSTTAIVSLLDKKGEGTCLTVKGFASRVEIVDITK